MREGDAAGIEESKITNNNPSVMNEAITEKAEDFSIYESNFDEEMKATVNLSTD